MNIVLGFGSTEDSYRDKVKRQIKVIVEECVADKFEKLDDVWFGEEILKEIETKVGEYAKEIREEEKEIAKKDIKDRPERYSYFYANFVGDGANLFFGLDFSHINSRHPMSPDGMAMMSIRDCKWIRVWDFRDGDLELSLKTLSHLQEEITPHRQIDE